MNAAHFHFFVGQYACLVLKSGERDRVHRTLVPDIPEDELVEALKEIGMTGESFVASYNNLLIKAAGKNVLVDAGLRISAEMLKQFEQAGLRSSLNLLEHLAEAGCSVNAIDLIVITHADGDHVGGILNEDLTLRFPNAEYVMWQGAWDLHNSSDASDPRGKPQDFIENTIPRIKDRVILVELGEEFLPGISLENGYGHRKDHVFVKIESGGETLLHIADGVIHPVQFVRPDWAAVYDSYKEDAASTRKEMLKQAHQNDILIFGSHLPFPAIGKITHTGDAWEWSPVTLS